MAAAVAVAAAAAVAFGGISTHLELRDPTIFVRARIDQLRGVFQLLIDGNHRAGARRVNVIGRLRTPL